MRARLRFTKCGKVRFTSHRDVARTFERALRRASLPIAYTAGFSPRPKLSFGLALSTGHESRSEFLEIDFDADADALNVDELPDLLSPLLPTGIDITAAAPVEPGEPSLQESVASCSWRIEVVGLAQPDAVERVADVLAASELIVTRQRKGKDITDDLRPAIVSVAVVGVTPAGVELDADLAVHPRSARPSELIAALAPGHEEGAVRRTAQWIWRDGARLEPLTPRKLVSSRPHAELRAS